MSLAPIIAWLLASASAPASATYTDQAAPFDPAAFASAQGQGRVILLETYAPWCLPCRVRGPAVRSLLREKPFERVLYMRIGEKNPGGHWKLIGARNYGVLHLYKGPRLIARSAATKRDEMARMLYLAYQEPRS